MLLYLSNILHNSCCHTNKYRKEEEAMLSLLLGVFVNWMSNLLSSLFVFSPSLMYLFCHCRLCGISCWLACVPPGVRTSSTNIGSPTQLRNASCAVHHITQHFIELLWLLFVSWTMSELHARCSCHHCYFMSMSIIFGGWRTTFRGVEKVIILFHRSLLMSGRFRSVRLLWCKAWTWNGMQDSVFSVDGTTPPYYGSIPSSNELLFYFYFSLTIHGNKEYQGIEEDQDETSRTVQ